MGLFSGRTTVHVGTSVSRAIADEVLPNAVKTGILNAIIGDGQVVENILEGMVGSIGVRAERMYTYAKDHYAWGLPSSEMVSANSGLTEITAALQTIVGVGTVVNYHHFGPINTLHLGWKSLVEVHGYDSSTNQLAGLTALKGTPVYLKDMEVVVTDATLPELANGSLDQWGTSPKAGFTPARADSSLFQTTPSSFRVEAGAASDYVIVTYVWETSASSVVNGVTLYTKTLHEDTFPIAIDTYPNQDYFQVKYTYAGKAGYWIYEWKSGVLPGIEAIFDTAQTSTGTYFPFTYFRYNKVSAAADTLSAGYTTSVKMLNTIGMDFAQITDKVHENPGIADVEQAMLMFAVPATTTNAMEQRYLFEYFKRMAGDAKDLGITPANTLATLSVNNVQTDTPPQISVVIEDSKFKMALRCLGISKRTKTGVVAAKGKYVSGMDTSTVNKVGHDYLTEEIVNWASPVSRHFYQHQVSETVYEEVQIFGLQMAYYIDGEHMAIGDEGDDILLIPLDYSLTTVYTLSEREELYSRSLHYVFNSRVVIKAKWYESGLFKAFVMVVMFVIAAYSLGAALPEIMAAMATLETAVVFLAMKILVFVISTIAVKLFVKAVGFKIAFIVAIIAAAAGLYFLDDIAGLTGAPWAKDLLTLSSNLTSGIQTVLKSSMADIQNSALVFQSEVTTKIELLEAANKLLESNNRLSPLVIFGETPDEFYNRTVHSGNIGVLGIEAISSYVDIALTLPKLSTSVQGGLYA